MIENNFDKSMQNGSETNRPMIINDSIKIIMLCSLTAQSSVIYESVVKARPHTKKKKKSLTCPCPVLILKRGQSVLLKKGEFVLQALYGRTISCLIKSDTVFIGLYDAPHKAPRMKYKIEARR